jgi:DNA-binding CsgD family transcriptional regulator
MAKPPLLDQSKKVLDFTVPAPRSTAVTATPGPFAPPELKVGGRRYRLVLVDPEEAGDATPSVVELLTPRELQIVALVASGNVNKQVADILRISEWTVSTHLRRIFAKLGVDTRAAMVSRCVGEIPPFKPDVS